MQWMQQYFILYLLQKRRVFVNGHQNNSRFPKIVPLRDRSSILKRLDLLLSTGVDVYVTFQVLD